MKLLNSSKHSLYSAGTSLLLGSLLSFSALQAHASADSGSAITAAELQQSGYNFPTDLVTGANTTQLANYAWRLFIASTQNTTATLTDGSGRGFASTNSNFIDSGNAPAKPNPLVFESFYHRTEAFPYYATASQKPNPPIGQVPKYYSFYESGGAKVPFPTVQNQQYVTLDETNQISQNFLYYQHSNDADFPVLFMAKVNDIETNYVWDKPKPSSTSSFQFPNNVVEVKTAWRRVQDIKNSDINDYHQAPATYYVANTAGIPHPVTEQFALIAIHIIQKTANYQQFIFTTFEHVDAVTRNASGAIIDPAYKTEYNYLSYQTPNVEPHTAVAHGAYTVNATGQPSQSNVNTTYTLPSKGAISQNFTTVVQPKTITKEVNDVNNSVNALVKSLDSNNVWANYRLKGVQATPTSDSTSSDYYLANISVESSQPGIQLFSGILLYGGVPLQGKTDPSKFYLVNCRGDKGSSSCIFPDPLLNTGTPPSTYNNVSIGVQEGKPVPAPTHNMGGCQGCHGAAQQLGRDFSFLANGVAGAGKELDSVPAAAMTAPAAKAHNVKMAKNNGAL